MSDIHTALVTGATSGIGRAAALKPARDGSKVLLHLLSGQPPHTLTPIQGEVPR